MKPLMLLNVIGEWCLMLACIDIHYYDDHAVAACILFDKWTDSNPTSQISTTITNIAPYIPGQFYLRELPCIIEVLKLVSEDPEVIIIDGHVWLDDNKSAGLGAHLYYSLNKKIPIIGIAKNPFKQSKIANEVIRGNSKKPLYVTTAGIDQNFAANNISKMHENYRIPTLLKKVDQLSRNITNGHQKSNHHGV